MLYCSSTRNSASANLYPNRIWFNKKVNNNYLLSCLHWAMDIWPFVNILWYFVGILSQFIQQWCTVCSVDSYITLQKVKYPHNIVYHVYVWGTFCQRDVRSWKRSYTYIPMGLLLFLITEMYKGIPLQLVDHLQGIRNHFADFLKIKYEEDKLPCSPSKLCWMWLGVCSYFVENFVLNFPYLRHGIHLI